MTYTFTVPIIVQIIPAKVEAKGTATIQVVITPAVTEPTRADILHTFIIKTSPLSINLSDAIIASAYDFLNRYITRYIDEDRELKTLLNYGEDRQSVALATRYGPEDINNLKSIQLKLLQPVPAEINEGDSVFLTREVAKSLIDKIRVRFAPQIDATPYLRPKNLRALNGLDTGNAIKNVTLSTLKLKSGSVGVTDPFKNKTFEDEIFRQWYSYDFNSAELNIDFSDYKNFVFYGSAAMRLEAFRQKLISLEKIEQNRIQFLSSSAYTVSTASAAYMFIQDKTAEYAKQKEEVIRGFDKYEQYLYFTPSGSTLNYSSSFDYVDGGIEYNPIGYWPKNSSGSVYEVYSDSAVEWYASQSAIAQRFDEFNENNIINTIPTHVREHDENSAYITFVSMIGHFFDNIKVFVDQSPYMYSRNLNPNEELSKDLVNDIAESIGFRLPSLDSTYELTNNILGTNEETPRRDLAAEIYKRLLHNLVFFAKSKGTRTALETFIKTFGVGPQLLGVKESGAPVTGSYYEFEEFSTGLDFDEGKTSYIRLPVAATARAPKVLQLNATFARNKLMTILNGDDKWALNVNVHPSISELGRLELTSGSNNVLIMSTSYHEIFGDKLINFAIKDNATTSSLYLIDTDGEDLLLFDETTIHGTFSTLWNSTDYVYLGGAGIRVAARYDGTLDEVRLWNDVVSNETLINSAFDPGSNAGDTYSSAADNLLVQISFNRINSSSWSPTSSLFNESPYKNISVSPSLEELFVFNISGSDFSRYTRAIRQDSIIVGSSGYLTNKVKVAPPPVFIDNSTGAKRLYRNESIVKPQQKRIQRGRNKVVIGSSPTEIINQNIIRNFGYENINYVLGSPTTLYNNFEKSLNSLKKFYQQYYYVNININRFIRIVSELSSVIDQVVDYFIPSKATLLKGIIIEPNILEQVKIPPVKSIKFYGKNSRRTLNAVGSLTSSAPDYGATFNISKDIDMLPTPNGTYASYDAQESLEILKLKAKTDKYFGTIEVDRPLTGSISDFKTTLDILNTDVGGKIDEYKAEIELSEINQVTGSVNSKTVTIKNFIETVAKFNVINSSLDSNIPVKEVPELQVKNNYYTSSILNLSKDKITSDYLTYTSSYSIKVSNLNKIPYNDQGNGSPGSEPYNRLYTRKLFESEKFTPRPGGISSVYVPALYEIPPSADFRDYGVYTYFDNRLGIYYFPEVRKTPAYSNPLNAVWDNDAQSFQNIPTWSYGARYNIYDVVYQDIDTTNTELQDLMKPAMAGNGRYYVFKNRPAYTLQNQQTALNIGSVPSYKPPSLDRDNWDVLRFTPVLKQVPKRVVFDIYTSPDPALNNFRTTTISIDRIIDSPDRYVDSFNIGYLGANSYAFGEILVQNIMLLFAAQSNASGLRLRLYRTPDARSLDFERSIETRPNGSHQVLVDVTLNSSNAYELINPIITLVAGASPPSGKLYFTINNLDSTVKSGVDLILYYFAIEIEPRIPNGYLRKHYRFFRDNNTATKRRNYDGCKNTQDTTVDGLPAVQVFISEGTSLTVSPTQTNTEIITGGGGQLNVT